MENTKLANGILKAGLDIDYFTEVLGKHKENEWILAKSNDYTVFSDLREHFLVARKDIPIWVNGSIKGVSVFFMFNYDLNFNLEPRT